MMMIKYLTLALKVRARAHSVKKKSAAQQLRPFSTAGSGVGSHSKPTKIGKL
jgi:hypothetical protein